MIDQSTRNVANISESEPPVAGVYECLKQKHYCLCEEPWCEIKGKVMIIVIPGLYTGICGTPDTKLNGK